MKNGERQNCSKITVRKIKMVEILTVRMSTDRIKDDKNDVLAFFWAIGNLVKKTHDQMS